MGGFFAAASRENCIFDVFFGTDYHSHLGTRRAGMIMYDSKDGYQRAIHNIENSPFRTKFESEVNDMHGNMGIGCISDYDPQPLLVRSHHGTFAIMTVGRINNHNELVKEMFDGGKMHFLEMSGGLINKTELVAALINQKDNLVDGIRFAQEQIEGSMSMVVLTDKGIFCARDKLGRTPIAIGMKPDGFCASFEAFAYKKLGYRDYKELGPGEIDVITPEQVTILVKTSYTLEAAQKEIETLMRDRHDIFEGNPDDFTIMNVQEILNAVGDIMGTFTLFLGGVAAISLLVGGIGIMNIMLVTVTERTREIGLRKALGAKKGDILAQFLVESSVLSLVGGILGILFGLLLAFGIARIAAMTGTELDVMVSPGIVLGATLFSIAVGLFFGVYPANKAANLEPVIALRSE